jgi:hypothetical protein
VTTTTVYDWGQAIMTSVAAALVMFLGAIPKIIGFLAILVIGWMIAGALSGIVVRMLRAVRFNDLAERSGFSGFVRNMGVHSDASGVLATTVNWFLRLIVLVVAFDALGLPAVSQVLQQFLLWIPNLVVALVILVIAGLAANALHSIVRGATAQAGIGNADLLASIARIAVWVFAVVVAVNQIGIATTLVNTLFMGVVGALALSFGLAFGLGGRDTASQIVSGWYRSAQREAPRLSQAADAAGHQLQDAAEDYQEPRNAPGRYAS